MWLVPLMSSSALACGGFFCSGTTTATYTQVAEVPVEQNGERILFEVNDDDTITTFVEVGFERTDDVDFAWIIPLPEAIDADQVATASADLFNELEAATAPRFSFLWTETIRTGGGSSGDPARGCGLGCGGGVAITDLGSKTGDGSGWTDTGLSAAVEVVDEAVVGPFAIEVITAGDAEIFATWLADNGYDLPDNAIEPLQHYIDGQMAFLGVQLAPDVPEGPIDTLQFTYPATTPMIPLILTAIASVDDLPMQVYVLADEPYAPSGGARARSEATGWVQGGDVALATQPTPEGTDYLQRVADEIDAHNGQAFVLELSRPTSQITLSDPAYDARLRQGAWLTRWRGDVSPWQMTLDPVFVPTPSLPSYDNEHRIRLDGPPATTVLRGDRSLLLLIAPLAGVGLLRRRRR